MASIWLVSSNRQYPLDSFTHAVYGDFEGAVVAVCVPLLPGFLLEALEMDEYGEGRSDTESVFEIDNFYDYVERYNDLVEDADWESGEILAELLSVKGKHANLSVLQVCI